MSLLFVVFLCFKFDFIFLFEALLISHCGGLFFKVEGGFSVDELFLFPQVLLDLLFRLYTELINSFLSIL